MKLTNATVKIGNKVIRRFNVLTTDRWVYDVWEPYGSHSSLTTIDGEHLGEVSRRPLPREIEGMKHWSDERIEAVRAFHRANWEECAQSILEAFPEAAAGRMEGGECVLEAGSVEFKRWVEKDGAHDAGRRAYAEFRANNPTSATDRELTLAWLSGFREAAEDAEVDAAVEAANRDGGRERFCCD